MKTKSSKKIYLNVFSILLMVISLIAVSGLVSYTVSNFASNSSIFNQTRFEPNNITHLEINSTAERVARFYGGSGSSDYVSFNAPTGLNMTKGSFSLWFNRGGNCASNCGLLGTNNGVSDRLQIWYMSANNLIFQAGGSTIMTSNTTYTTEGWHYLVVNYDFDADVYSMYVDDNIVASSTSPYSPQTKNTVWKIGVGEFSSNYYVFKGSIDEVMIFNRTLNTTEISNIYSENRSTFSGNTTDLVSYYTFDEVEYSIATDYASQRTASFGGTSRKLVDSLFDNIRNNPFGSYLQAYYSFDADNTGEPNWTTGKIGNALDFDGSNDYVQFTNSLNSLVSNSVTNLTTASAWVKYKSFSATDTMILGSDSGSSIKVMLGHKGDADQPGCHKYNAPTWYSATITAPLQLNQWYNLACVYNGTHLQIYLNGILNASTSVANTSTFAPTNWYIGRRWDSANTINATLDEIKMFNTSLTASQILDMYNNESIGTVYPDRTNLVSEWSFNQSGGNWTLTDSSGNNNNGALFNFQSSLTSYDLTNNNYDGTYGNILYAGSSPYHLGISGAGLSGSTLTLPTTLDDAMTNGFTYSVWARKDGNSSGSTTQVTLLSNYFSGTPLLSSYITQNNRLVYILGSSPSVYNIVNTSDGAINLGDWNHYTFTYNGTISDANSLKMYINGVEVGTKSQVGGTPSGTFVTANNLWIGYTGSGGSAGGFLNGSIDEVMIFSKALNATEISDIYNNQSKRFKTEGTVGFAPVGLNESANAVNISLNNAQTNFGTSIQARAGYWNENNGYALGEGEAVFDGSGDYITVSNINNYLNGTTEMAVCAWVNPASSTSVDNSVILGGVTTSDWGLVASDTANTYGFRIAGLGSGGIKIQQNEWTHLCGVYNGTHYYTVYNGTGVSTIVSYTNPVVSTSNKFIGYYGALTRYFNGSIDEVIIFNRSLNSTEIQNIYNQNRSYYNGNSSGLVSYYTFDNYKSFYSDSLGLNNGTKLGDTKVKWSNNSLTAGLVGYWSLDSTNGTANWTNDYSGNNNNGRCTNMGSNCNFTTGVFNNSINFDGSNDYVEAQNVNATYSGIAISHWVYPRSSGSVRSTVSHRNYTGGDSGQFQIDLSTTNTVQFYLYNVSAWITATSTGTLTTNQWNHVLVTNNGSNSIIYINGVGQTLTQFYPGGTLTNRNVTIGRNPFSGGTTYFNGSIDDVMIWNRSLSATEARELYNNGLANWSYGNWKTISEGNVSLTLPINATTIRPEYKLFDGTAEGWYTPYLDFSTLRLTTDSGGISTSASYSTGTTLTGGYNQSFITANISATPEDLVSSVIVYLYNSSGLRNSSIIESPYFVNFTNLQNDRYYLNATVSFSTGETETLETRIIYLDSVAPNATLITPIDGNKTNQTQVNFTANITDNLGIANYTLNIYNDTSDTLWTSITNTTSNFFGQTTTQTIGTVVGVVEGFFTWFYQIFDLAGNVFTTSNNSINISYLPQIQIISPLNTTYYISDTSSEITINFTATDANGISNLWFYNTSSNQNVSYSAPVASSYNLGQNNITFYANDTLGDLNSTTRYFTLSSLQLHSIDNAIALPDELDNVIVYANVTNYHSGSLTCNLTGDLGTYSNTTSGSGNFNLSFNTGKKSAATYNYQVTCDNDIEPSTKSLSSSVRVTRQINLQPESSQPIYLSQSNPDVGQNITIYANVKSLYRGSNNIQVDFYVGSTYIGSDNTSSISADGTGIAEISYAFNQNGFIPIKIAINPSQTINESSFTDNNITRAFSVGLELEQGGILITNLTASPNPATQFSTYFISGYAVYNFSSNLPVASGQVTITIEGESEQLETTTNDLGFFNYTGIIANEEGTFNITVDVTDYGTQGNSTTNITISEPLVLGGSDFLVSDIYFNNISNANLVYAYQNETINLTATIRNIGDVSGNVSVNLFRGSLDISELEVLVDANGSSTNITFENIDLYSAGYNYFKIALNINNSSQDLNALNNNRTEYIYAYQNISDLYFVPSYISFSVTNPVQGAPYNITTYIRNYEGKDAENVSIYFYEDDVYIGQKNISLVRKFGNGTENATFEHTPSSDGIKTIKVAVNPLQTISESSYSNNNYTRTVTIYDQASPDFSIQDIAISSPGYFSSTSPYTQNIYADNVLNITVSVRNIGQANSSASIPINLYLNETLINSTSISGINVSQTRTASVLYTIDKSSFNLSQLKNIKAVVNPSGSIDENSLTNNNYSESYYLVMPDLYFQGAITLSKNVVLENESVVFNATIFNNAPLGIEAKNISVLFYIADSSNTSHIAGTTYTNISGQNSQLVSYNWTLPSPEGIYTVYASVNDGYKQYEKEYSNPWAYKSNNNLLSQSPFSIDSGGPEISNLTLNYTTESISFIEDVDPSTLITFTFNVTDINGVQEVKFQYINNSSDWTNITVNNITEEIYSLDFETAPNDSYYIYRIFAIDTNDKVRVTQNYTLNSTWDCTWNLTTNTLGPEGFFGGYKTLGIINISNNGDANYSNGDGCIIKFGRNSAGSNWHTTDTISLNFSQDYLFESVLSGYSSQMGLRYYINNTEVTNANLSQRENLSLEVKGFFPSADEILTEYPTFNISSNITDTYYNRNTEVITATMIITPGAYLINEITSPTSSEYFIDLFNEAIYNFSTYVRNVVDGSTDPDNTAYNVSLNWTIPQELTSVSGLIVSGNLTFFNETLNDTSRQYLNFSLVLDSNTLSSITSTNNTYSVYSYAYGYENSTGNLTLINQGTNGVIFDSFTLRFFCSQTSSSALSPACRPLTITTPGSSSTGGGGGGGGGGAGSLAIKTEATFELVRGEKQEFQLPITNSYPNPKKNVNITINGIESKYIEISPKTISSIPGNSSKNITVTITAPAYFNQNASIIEFEIKGSVHTGNNTYSFTETKFVRLIILEFSRNQALKYINESRDNIQEMNNSNFIIKAVKESYLNMLKNYENIDFIKLKENYDLISLIHNSAFESKDLLAELKNSIEEAEFRGIEVIQTKKLLFAAETLFERGEYVLALEKLKEAKITFAIETKGEFNLFYEIKNNPLQYLGILIGISALGIGTTLATRYKYLKNRLRVLDDESQLLVQLMKVVQKECFEQNKMSMDEYQSAMYQYEKRLTETVEERISAETKLANLISLHGEVSAISQEKKRILGLMEKLQEDYLKKGAIETRLYESMMKIYSTRIMKLDEELAMFEAKEFLKRGK